MNKKDRYELALFGGKPVRNKKLYYGHQYIDEDDIEAVCRILKSDYLTCGPSVEKFEQELADYVGAKYAVAVSNGTAALHCACIAANIGAGDEVITTALTFAASANCVLYVGAKVVFADINPTTYLIDSNSIEEKITDKTKAVIAVDFAGVPVDSDSIRDVCIRHNLIFIEDAAHALGSKYKNSMIGSLADMTCFSFHPVKTITGGEGGAIATNDKNYYEKLVLARSHGIIRNSVASNGGQNPPWYYEQIDLGYNYRITDIQCALLVSQLKKIEWFKTRRKEISEKYNLAFKEMREIVIPTELAECDVCRHLYVIQLKLEYLDCDRKTFFEALSKEGVQCQVHYIPIYWFPYYVKLGYKKGICKNVEYVYERLISIPLYPGLSEEDVNDVIAAVKKVVSFFAVKQ